MFIAACLKIKTSPLAALPYVYLATLFSVLIVLVVMTHTTFERYTVTDAQNALLIPTMVAAFVASYDGLQLIKPTVVRAVAAFLAGYIMLSLIHLLVIFLIQPGLGGIALVG